MRTLGVVLMIDGRVLTILGSVSMTDGSVDCTEFSVHMTLGGLSWSPLVLHEYDARSNIDKLLQKVR